MQRFNNFLFRSVSSPVPSPTGNPFRLRRSASRGTRRSSRTFAWVRESLIDTPWIKEHPADYIQGACDISVRVAAAVRLGVRDRQAGSQADSRHWEEPLLPLRWVVEREREWRGLSGGKSEGDPERPRTQGSSDADSDSRGTWASAGDGAAEPPPAPSARHLPPGGPGNIAEGLWCLSRWLSRCRSDGVPYYAILRLSVWPQGNVISDFRTSNETL